MKKRLTVVTALLSLTLAQTALAASQFYTVQLSSPVSKAKAKEQIDKFKKQGIDAFEVKATVNGKKRYRIVAGYFEKHAQADEARRHFSKMTRRKDIFVQKLRGKDLPNSMIFPTEEDRLSEW